MIRIGLTILIGAIATQPIAQGAPDAKAIQAERARIEVMARASTATIAVFDGQGEGGGSGVVISPDGYALTNFHVTAPSGPAMKCGMADSKIYDAVIVGVDPVGDVALIQLLGRDDFPSAPLGDSDFVRAGDWVFAAGNPFLLADDFSPSISYGIVSGVRRYQYPAGTLLEYTDCIQTDAAINPGNSGGPLFDAEGRVIGINGRGSFEKRGRVNVGVGYAISINQIKRFLAHLKSGRIVDHASLGAIVSTQDDGRVRVDDILESSDAYRRGMRYGDEIVTFGDRKITSANRLKNALGVYPPEWIVPLTYRRDGTTVDTHVRLARLHDPSQLSGFVQEQQQKPPQRPEEQSPKEEQPLPDEPKPQTHPSARDKMPKQVADRYEPRRGFANYWYNRQHQQRLWKALCEENDVAPTGYRWNLRGETADGEPFHLKTTPAKATFRLMHGNFAAQFSMALDAELSPPGSGGLLVAVHLWQRFLDKGLRKFGNVYYLGQLPAAPDGNLVDCLIGVYDSVEARFLFHPSSGTLVGIDVYPSEESDPCELRFVEYDEINGRHLPKRWSIRFAGKRYAELVIQDWKYGNE